VHRRASAVEFSCFLCIAARAHSRAGASARRASGHPMHRRGPHRSRRSRRRGGNTPCTCTPRSNTHRRSAGASGCATRHPASVTEASLLSGHCQDKPVQADPARRQQCTVVRAKPHAT
jgi:hypothetical protein